MIRRNRQTGTSMVELPLAILIVFIFGAFPFMALSTIALRMAFVHLTCYEAVRAAAGSQTYSLAQTAAQGVFTNFAQFFPGITYGFSTSSSKPSLQIYQTPLAGGVPKQYTTSQPIQTGTYLYQYQVSVPAEIEPIIKYSGNLFGKVPGWTAPIKLDVAAVAYCENPAGLTQ